MTRTHLGLVLPPAAVAALAVALTTPAVTDQDTCISGFVWRGASPSDHVCVKAGWRTRSTCRIRRPLPTTSPIVAPAFRGSCGAKGSATRPRRVERGHFRVVQAEAERADSAMLSDRGAQVDGVSPTVAETLRRYVIGQRPEVGRTYMLVEAEQPVDD